LGLFPAVLIIVLLLYGPSCMLLRSGTLSFRGSNQAGLAAHGGVDTYTV
jgi:hypothetical protein